MTIHYVYIIKSLRDGTLYKGYTTDYLKRLRDHNCGLSQYTSTKIPWDLVYAEICQDKKAALIRERKLKRCNIDYLKWLIEQKSNILKTAD